MTPEIQLFDYVIFFRPTAEQKKEGQKAKILVERKTILAESNQTATLLAARDIPAEYVDQMDQLVVAVRRF